MENNDTAARIAEKILSTEPGYEKDSDRERMIARIVRHHMSPLAGALARIAGMTRPTLETLRNQSMGVGRDSLAPAQDIARAALRAAGILEE